MSPPDKFCCCTWRTSTKIVATMEFFMEISFFFVMIGVILKYFILQEYIEVKPSRISPELSILTTASIHATISLISVIASNVLYKGAKETDRRSTKCLVWICWTTLRTLALLTHIAILAFCQVYSTQFRYSCILFLFTRVAILTCELAIVVAFDVYRYEVGCAFNKLVPESRYNIQPGRNFRRLEFEGRSRV